MEKDTPYQVAKSAGKAKAGPGNREVTGGGAGWVQGAVMSHRGTGQPLRGVAFEQGQRHLRMEGVLGRGDGTASAKVPRQLSVCADGWCVAAE